MKRRFGRSASCPQSPWLPHCLRMFPTCWGMRGSPWFGSDGQFLAGRATCVCWALHPVHLPTPHHSLPQLNQIHPNERVCMYAHACGCAAHIHASMHTRLRMHVDSPVFPRRLSHQ
eukprot:366410-Chlamydomonas_euryale.AAC.30